VTRLLTAFVAEHGLPALIAEAAGVAMVFVLLGAAFLMPTEAAPDNAAGRAAISAGAN
jgi:hypothetical protein